MIGYTESIAASLLSAFSRLERRTFTLLWEDLDPKRKKHCPGIPSEGVSGLSREKRGS